MTEQDTTVDTATPPADADTDGTPSGDAQDARKGPHAEAAKYRIRAREAEQARDTLQARVDALLTAEARRLAADSLANPGDLDLSGKALADLVDADGNVDAELVAAAVAEVLSTRPALSKYQPAVDMTQGSGNLPQHGKSGPSSWADLLK